MDTRRTTSRATRLFAVLVTGVCALRAAPPVAAAPGIAAPVNAVIDAGKTFAPINPNLYGMFIEHAGGLVYSGMWAEMIDDRKFYNPITAQDPAQAGPHSRRARGGRAAALAAHLAAGLPSARLNPSPWTPSTPTSATTPPRSRSAPASLAASARRA